MDSDLCGRQDSNISFSEIAAWDIDPDVDSDVVWSNKVDLCPDSCYVDSVPLDEVEAIRRAKVEIANGKVYDLASIQWPD